MENLRVALLQNDIVWEDVAANLSCCESRLSTLAGNVHLAVLPEMFTTGFSMNASALAEECDGVTVQTLKQWSSCFDMAIAGSYIARERGHCYNRGFFVKPDGEVIFYDKRHLFRMGEEGRFFTSGKERVVVDYLGWHIALFICYDLRFPVWCRNVGNEYDLALFVASWPEARAHVWRTLLIARAIENEAYVCGVNRVGEDGNRLVYTGDTMAVDYKGTVIGKAANGGKDAVVVELDGDKLHLFRERFPVWCDADSFMIRS